MSGCIPVTSGLRHWMISRTPREKRWPFAILSVVVLRLHEGVKLEVLRGHGIRIRQVGRHEFVVPGFLLGLALPDFANGEAAGNRIRDVHYEAGLLLQKRVKYGGHLVVGRLIHSGGGNFDEYGHWFSLCNWCVAGEYTYFPCHSSRWNASVFWQRRSTSGPLLREQQEAAYRDVGCGLTSRRCSVADLLM